MKKLDITVIGINSEEFVPGSYKSVYLYVGKEKKEFSTGNPVIDFKKALDYGLKFGKVVYSSSVDNFVMDDPAYDYDENNLIVKV
jgi:hypothetical protein